MTHNNDEQAILDQERRALDQWASGNPLAALERASALAADNTILLGQLGHAYAVTGRTDQARDVLVRLNDPVASRYLSPRVRVFRAW